MIITIVSILASLLAVLIYSLCRLTFIGENEAGAVITLGKFYDEKASKRLNEKKWTVIFNPFKSVCKTEGIDYVIKQPGITYVLYDISSETGKEYKKLEIPKESGVLRLNRLKQSPIAVPSESINNQLEFNIDDPISVEDQSGNRMLVTGKILVNYKITDPVKLVKTLLISNTKAPTAQSISKKDIDHYIESNLKSNATSSMTNGKLSRDILPNPSFDQSEEEQKYDDDYQKKLVKLKSNKPNTQNNDLSSLLRPCYEDFNKNDTLSAGISIQSMQFEGAITDENVKKAMEAGLLATSRNKVKLFNAKINAQAKGIEAEATANFLTKVRNTVATTVKAISEQLKKSNPKASDEALLSASVQIINTQLTAETLKDSDNNGNKTIIVLSSAGGTGQTNLSQAFQAKQLADGSNSLNQFGNNNRI